MTQIDRFWIVSNHNADPSEVLAVLTDPYQVFQQGCDSLLPADIPSEKILYTKHSGHNLSDYLGFIINNYRQLPDEVGMIKGNIFPRHIEKHLFEKKITLGGPQFFFSQRRQDFGKIKKKWGILPTGFEVVSGQWLEHNDNWYCRKRPKGKYFRTFDDLHWRVFGRRSSPYILFCPGACMLVPSANIRQWPIDLYLELYDAVTYSHFPVEAFHLERLMLAMFGTSATSVS